jgi:hypothetical protein
MSGAETLSSLNCMSAPVVMMELACVWEKRGESKGKSCMSTTVSFVNTDSAGTEISLLDEVAGRHCYLGAPGLFVELKNPFSGMSHYVLSEKGKRVKVANTSTCEFTD